MALPSLGTGCGGPPAVRFRSGLPGSLRPPTSPSTPPPPALWTDATGAWPTAGGQRRRIRPPSPRTTRRPPAGDGRGRGEAHSPPPATASGRSSMMEDVRKMNVESFNLDHRAVKAPYVRVADTKALPGGDVLTKFDIRFCQPNVEHLEMPVVHSLEHLMAEHMRNHSDAVIDISPMGCQTGLYPPIRNTGSAELVDVLGTTLGDGIAAGEVPAANDGQCGSAASHDPAGAQRVAQ